MPAPVGDWTVAMLEALPDDGKRYEIIDGELFLTPAPTYAHQRIVRQLTFWFEQYLRDSSRAEVIPSPAEVRAGERTSVEPDLFVIPLVNGEPMPGPAQLSEVLLAVEVLSPSTVGLDRYKKRVKYQQEGVAEYWIVDPDARFVERWRPGDDQPEIARGRITWTAPAAHASLDIDLEALFRFSFR